MYIPRQRNLLREEAQRSAARQGSGQTPRTREMRSRSALSKYLCLVFVGAAYSAKMRLAGDGSSILMNGASLSAHCTGDDAPAVRSITFTPFGNRIAQHNGSHWNSYGYEDETHVARARLHNVPIHCVDVNSLTSPCVVDDPPADFWYCVWAGPQGEQTIGPLTANYSVLYEHFAGGLVGFIPYLDCGFPTKDGFRHITGYTQGERKALPLKLTIKARTLRCRQK